MSHGVYGSSIVELTNHPFFRREYSSLFIAIKNYYCKRDETEDNRIVLRESARKGIFTYLTKTYTEGKERNIYALDTTNRSKKNSKKATDKKYVRGQNNRFSEPGYEYSSLCNLQGEGWALPVSTKRVKSYENKYDVGKMQILDAHLNSDKDSMTIAVADAAYSNANFLSSLRQKPDIITITRERINRRIFREFDGKQKNKGAKRFYGDKYNLSKDSEELTANHITSFEEVTKKGNKRKVIISEYKNYLVIGKKNHTMKNKPMNFIKVEVYNLEETKVYKNDLWLCVSGKKRGSLSAKKVYELYKTRFDIEHFFKFGKSKLRMDKFQTINPDKEEDFLMFVMLSYHFLYQIKDTTKQEISSKWYPKKDVDNAITPAEAYRAAPTITSNFTNITNPAIKRGIPNKKNIRRNFKCHDDSKVIKKGIKSTNLDISIKLPLCKKQIFSKTAVNINLKNQSANKEEVLAKFLKMLDKNGIKLE
jgi:hypothetical protein